MKLLDPQEVKTAKDDAETARVERIQKMNDEESLIVKKLNLMRVEYETEGNKLIQGLADLKTEYTSKKQELEREVSSLETRKSEAMKPIDALNKEAENRNMASKAREEAVEIREKDLTEREEELVDKILLVREKDDSLQVVYQNLEKRKVHITDEETRLKESQGKLAEKWMEYHKEVNTTSSDLDRRELEVTIGQQTIKNGRDANLQERKRLDKEWCTIRDTYKAIEQAKKHLGQD